MPAAQAAGFTTPVTIRGMDASAAAGRVACTLAELAGRQFPTQAQMLEAAELLGG